jgi:hypothetical protein
MFTSFSKMAFDPKSSTQSRTEVFEEMFHRREQNMQMHVYTGCSKLVETSTDEASTARST